LSHETLGGATGSDFQCLPLYSLLLALGNPTVNYFRQKLHSEAKSQQEKTTFENNISLANQISKWLLLALGNPTVNYFRQKLQWQNFSQEKTKI
jgi:hypothetical protein